MKRFGRLVIAAAIGALLTADFFPATAGTVDSFSAGIKACENGDFNSAAESFREAARKQPATGVLLNLGNAEWKSDHTAEAILAWERARLLNPYDANARNNLRFARDAAQLESPQLAWHEVASTWLPANVWGWIAGGSLWVAIGTLVLPGVLRLRKSSWQQAVAALGLGIFLLTIPANIGVLTRARIGFVLAGDTSLRLTPTAGGEAITKLAAGEPARLIRAHGDYVFIRTSHASGWLVRDEFELITRDL